MKRYRHAAASRAAGSSTTRPRAALAQGLKDEYRIAAPSIDTEARLLSGGNLQRLIFAREIDTGPRLHRRRPADPRPRRRRDRGGPPGPARAARGGRRDPAHLRGPRRDPGPVRPGRRHVRGPDRRLVPDRRRPTSHEIGLLMTGGPDAGAGSEDDRPVPAAGQRIAMTLRLEPRTDAPRWFTALHDPRGAGLRARPERADHLARRWRPGPVVRPHRQRRVRQRRGHQRHAGQGDAADPHRPGLLAGLPDAALEHRGGGPVPAGRLGCERDRPRPDPAGRDAGHRGHPGDDAGRRAGRRPVGLHPGRAPGASRGQRDHHHPDAQLRGPVLGPVLGVRSVEQGRLSRDRAVPARGLAAPPDRLRRDVPGPGRPDRPPRAHLRDRRRGDHVGRPRAHPLGLRDPAHRRQPAGRALRRHRHRAQDHRGLRHLRAPWPGWAG